MVKLAGTGYYLTARQHFAKAKCSRDKQGKLKQPPAVFALTGSTLGSTPPKKLEDNLEHFWWSWRVLPPRPIANKLDDYRLRPFKIS
jgi:hypothetical protein